MNRVGTFGLALLLGLVGWALPFLAAGAIEARAGIDPAAQVAGAVQLWLFGSLLLGVPLILVSRFALVRGALQHVLAGVAIQFIWGMANVAAAAMLARQVPALAVGGSLLSLAGGAAAGLIVHRLRNLAPRKA